MLDFSVKKWADTDKSIVHKLQSHCLFCKNEWQREYRKNLTDRQRKTIRASNRVRQRRIRREAAIPERNGGPYRRTGKHGGSVPREPFVQWIKEKLENGVGITELSQQTGVAERLLRSYVNGYDRTARRSKSPLDSKARKLRAVDWISFRTVDRALAAYGEGYSSSKRYPSP